MIGALFLRSAGRAATDNRVEWDTDEPETVELAAAVWDESSRVGFAFFAGRRRMPETMILAGFDPATAPRETVIIAPALTG